MAKPDIYRDTPLYWFMGLAVIILSAVHFLSFPAIAGETIEITFAGPCCDGTKCPITTALTSVGAGSEVRHRFSGSETTLTLNAPSDASPRLLWEAVEDAQRQPLRLVRGGRKFASKPAL